MPDHPDLMTRLTFIVDGKTGYVGDDGELVIPPRFRSARFFDPVSGVAAACEKADQWGFINWEGRWVVEPKFHRVENFDPNTGLAVAEILNWDDLSLPGGRIAGFINPSGIWEITPKFRDLKRFDLTTGLAPAKDCNEGTWGLIDRKGNWAVPRHFCDIDTFPGSDGLFWVEVALEHRVDVSRGNRSTSSIGGNWGVIDKNGDWVIEPQFSSVRVKSCEAGLAWGIFGGINGQEMGVDSKGRLIAFDPPADSISEFNSETGLAVACAGDRSTNLGWVSRVGRWVLPPRFASLGSLDAGCGLAVAGTHSSKMLGWIDERGEWALHPKFEALDLPSPCDGLAWANENKVWSVIDRKGHIVAAFPELTGVAIDSSSRLSNVEVKAWVGAGSEKRCGWFDRKSGWIVSPRYLALQALPFHDSEPKFFWVEFENEENETAQYGLIDRKGCELSPTRITRGVDWPDITFLECGGSWSFLEVWFGRLPRAVTSYGFYLNQDTGKVIIQDPYRL